MRKWGVAGVAALLLVAGSIARFFVFPSTDSPPPVDAVVVLAGDAPTRLPVAVDLAESRSEPLVISAAVGTVNAPARELCEDPGSLTVLCFAPSPSNTRGEASAIGQLVAEHGWDSIAVVTSSAHVTRAGLLVGRCTDAAVHMVQARPSLSPSRWAHHVAHELGGLVESGVRRSC